MSNAIAPYQGMSAYQRQYNDDFARLSMYKRRYMMAQAIADQWRGILQMAQMFCVPNRNIFDYKYIPNSQGQIKNALVFDTTPMVATRKFVAKIHDAMTPAQMDWCTLESSQPLDTLVQRDGEPLNDEQKRLVEEFLEMLGKKLFGYVHKSNFDLVVHEFYQDLAISTGILCVNEGDDENPFIHRSIPLASVAFEESLSGQVNTVFYTHYNIRIMDIEILWPNVTLPIELQEAGELNTEARVAALYEGMVYWPKNPVNKRYCYALWTEGVIIHEEFMPKSDWVVTRWDKVNTDCFGRGVGVLALPSIISLQEICKLELKSANFNIDRPYMAFSDNIFNPWTYRIDANSIIPVNNPGNGQWPIAPLPDVSNPAFASLTSNDLRQQINNIMFAAPIGEVDEAPVKTATEIAVRQRSLIEEIGPSFSRLLQEMLSPLVGVWLGIMKRKGLYKDLDFVEIVPKFKSPLVIAQGQKNVDTVLALVQSLQAAAGDDYVKFIDMSYIAPYFGEQLHAPAGSYLTQDQIMEAAQNQADLMQYQLSLAQDASMAGSKEMPTRALAA